MLQTLEIVGLQPGPQLLITGGVHGDEFEPMAAIRELAASVQPHELSGKLTLVPVVNEPAYFRGHRTGEDGLDLARTCPGNPAGSPTERIADALSQLIRAADFYIDLHTGGTRLMVWPLAGYVLHPDENILEEQRRLARAFGLPVIWGTDPTLEGRSLSVARDAGVPAIYCEYLGGGRMAPEGVAAYVRGCLSVMRELQMLPGAPEPSPEPLIIEDHRPGAGHMQVNHPSPLEGFFQPAVSLGQRVRAGDALGSVCDIRGQQKQTIHSRYTGMVIVLHSFPLVALQESVAVVMEIADR